MVDRTLHIRLDAHIDQPGPNPTWEHEAEIEVPPDYVEQDIAPFVRHELERAVATLEREQLGEERAAKIIAAYELRSRVIRLLLRRAARTREAQELVSRVQEILDADNDVLFTLWGRLGLED